MSLIHTLAKVNYNQVKPALRGFHVNSETVSKRLERIGSTFLDGYHFALKTSDPEKIHSFPESLEEKYRGFAYEGIGMGMTLRGYFTFKGDAPVYSFLNGLGNDHIYLLYVGIGWAYARLPFINIEKRIKKFDPLLRWLVIDGYGFHEAYFKTKKYIINKELPKLTQKAQHVFYQGVGRCLWFVYGTEVKKIASKIREFPSMFQPDLWAGIGLAATYAGTLSKADLLKIKQFSNPFSMHLLQGVSFAAGARCRPNLVSPYTRIATKTLTGLDPEELSAINDQALKNIPSYLSSFEQNRLWKKNIIQQITMQTSTKSYETAI
jgi:hypothetical protein